MLADAAENQFSFANPIRRAGGIERSNMNQKDHAVVLRADDRADDHLKLSGWTRKSSFNYDYYEHDEENMGFQMTQSANSSPMHERYLSKQLYPTSRAQEIARYRQEMLDLVRDLPEPAYELSLRDLVEAPRAAKSAPETMEKRREDARSKADKVKEKGKWTRRLSRNETAETGLFLKMFVPISLGRSRIKSSGGSNSCAKVSPKPAPAESDKGGVEKMEGERWEKNSSNGSSESSRSTSSSRSRKMRGCYAFFHVNKSRSRES